MRLEFTGSFEIEPKLIGNDTPDPTIMLLIVLTLMYQMMYEYD
jgi:hypothetical protein